MESQPTIRQRFNSDLQNRLALIAYVPILCLGVLAAGGLIFLQGSTGVRIFGIFALLGVALSLFIAYRTISSVLATIGRVAGSAHALVEAQHALLDNDAAPIEAWARIETDSEDELGQLAASINAMHTNTVEVDRNQNESIKKGISNIVINLARRSQTLLDRQVEYIDTLERSEEDPDRLEQMFKVDHLATRMRRNAESLLVLAEADPGRRRGGPVDVADVLRVAMGEIENYQHIELTSVEPGQVTSAAAVDLAHMAAELMENATQFSPPEAPVEVSGRLDGERYVVSIVDHGMGMPDDQRRAANEVLSNPPELGLAMGRSLGFVVIGRLAQRLGASVDLSETPNSGITATIAVPTSAFSKVGDNSGVRRSIVAPEVRDSPVEPAPEDSGRSPALTKLLGLDKSSLGGEPTEQGTSSDSATPVAEAVWTPPPVTPDAPAPVIPGVGAVEEPAWTPPPVTPEAEPGSAAPVEPEVAVAEEPAWTPPPVTPEAEPGSAAPVEPEVAVAEEPAWDGTACYARCRHREHREHREPVPALRRLKAAKSKPGPHRPSRLRTPSAHRSPCRMARHRRIWKRRFRQARRSNPEWPRCSTSRRRRHPLPPRRSTRRFKRPRRALPGAVGGNQKYRSAKADPWPPARASRKRFDPCSRGTGRASKAESKKMHPLKSTLVRRGNGETER